MGSTARFCCRYLFLIVGFCFPLHAWSFPCPDPITIRGELLYFSPSYDETYFVINGTGFDGLGNPTPDGKRVNNPIGYDLGFRLEGYCGVPNTCFDFGFRWTHIYARSHETVANFDMPAQLWPTAIIPSQPNVPAPFSGTATSHIGVMYQKGEILFDESLWNLSCFHFTFRQAIEWSYIRYHEKVEYSAAVGDEVIQFHGHTKGLGPQLGIIAICNPSEFLCWWPNLSFKCMTTASLIAANSKAKVKTEDLFAAQNKVTQSSFWRFVPEWCFSIGIQYTKCAATIELGYEMTAYFRGISKLIFDDTTSPGLSFNQYSDFYVHGLYLGLSFRF